jgi:hypothetical protein
MGWGDEPLSGVCECGEVVWKTALDLTLLMTLDDTIPNSLQTYQVGDFRWKYY